MQWNGTNLILVSNCALDIFQISRRRSTYSPQRQRTFMSSRIDGPNLQTLSILQLPRERGKLYSIREASVANNVWQGRRHASERKGSLCAAAVLLLPHGDYDTRQQTRSTLQRQRQIGMHSRRSPPRHVHRITYLGLFPNRLLTDFTRKWSLVLSLICI